MPSSEARTEHKVQAEEQGSPDSWDPVRGRHVSGYAPKSESSAAALACADDDAAPDAGEPTRVAPEELMETLREASRLDEPVHQPLDEPLSDQADAPSAVTGLVQQTTDEDDTLIFVLHETSFSRPFALRWAVGLVGAATLTCLFALSARHRALERPSAEIVRSEFAATQETVKQVTPAAPAVELPKPAPIIEQLVEPSSGVSQFTLETEPVVTQAPPEHDSSRKWKRALARGQRSLAEQEYDVAAFSFERAIEYNPDDSQSYLGLGEAHLGRGKWAEAVRAFEKAVELFPEDAALRAGLARAYERDGNALEAAKANERATERDAHSKEEDGTQPW